MLIVDYKEGYSASWDWKIGKDHFEGKMYPCVENVEKHCMIMKRM
jgi:hypothetical protein